MKKKFSYKEYIDIINVLGKKRAIVNYHDISRHEKFVLLRHDVEYSMKRSLDMAILENKNSIKSTYFFQIRNNTYNVLSEENTEICKNIISLGHEVGLHVHLGSLKYKNTLEEKDVKEIIKKDIDILSRNLDYNVRVFSYHRPTKKILTFNKNYDGYINAYNSKFFKLCDNLEEIKNEDVKYIADSNHKWKYGHPLSENILKYDKIHMLTHPFSWTEKGYKNYHNFLSLANEKVEEMIESMSNEISNFPNEIIERYTQ